MADLGGLAALEGLLLPLEQKPHFKIDPKTGMIVGATAAKPGEYPAATGAHYHGDVSGFVYDPYTDSYVAPRKAQSSFEQHMGIAPPSTSPWEQLLPGLAGAGGLAVISSLLGGKKGSDSSGDSSGLGSGLLALYDSIFGSNPAHFSDVPNFGDSFGSMNGPSAGTFSMPSSSQGQIGDSLLSGQDSSYSGDSGAGSDIGGVAGNALGNYLGGGWGGAVGSALGSYFGGYF